MRKLIIKYIISIMLIASVTLIGIFYAFNNSRKERSEITALDTVASRVISTLETDRENEEESKNLFIQNYIEKAKALSYVIEKTTNNSPSNGELQELAKKFTVDEIHVVDENGIIINSNKEESIHLNFYENNRMKKFVPLIESEDKEDYYLDLQGYNVNEKKEMIYIGVKLSKGGKGMLQLGIKPSVLEQYKQKVSMYSTIQSMPIGKSITIFAIDGETGDVLGVSDNYTGDISYSKEYKNTISFLKDSVENPRKVNIDGESMLMVVKEYEGDFILVISNLKSLHSDFSQYLIMMSVVILFLIMMVSWCLYNLIDYFMLSDVESMISGVDSFLSGNNEVKFLANPKTELYRMAEGLNKWVNSYESYSERISTIVSSMGETFATYEYFDDLHRVFYSENLPKMLEVGKEVCDEMIRNKFSERSISSYLDKVDDQVFLTKGGKHIKIKNMVSGNTYFGIIRDISEELKEHKKLSNALHEATEKASRDVLTGLYNRNKAKELIDDWFHEGNKDGVMLLMDLDNFKKINDEKGHPEGDKLLRDFCTLLKRQFRTFDIKARIGGDEFIVFMPSMIEEDILEAKLKSFLFICKEEWKDYYQEQELSVSIGVAYVDNFIHSYEELYRCADSAMYVAKRQGKDGYYINEDNVTCMRSECIYCRQNCKRRSILFGEANEKL